MPILSLKHLKVAAWPALLALSVASGLCAAAAREPTPVDEAKRPAAIVLPPLPDAPLKLDDDGSAAPRNSPAPQAPTPTDAPNRPAATPAAAPAAPLPPINVALKAALEALVKAHLPHGPAGVALRKQRKAIAAFYAERDDAPLWIDDGEWTTAARSALARLKLADEDGLDIAPSSLPRLVEGPLATLAKAELALSGAVVSYGRQAGGSRVDPHKISPLIAEKPRPATPARILATVASAADAGAALEDFNPPQAGYKALRRKLAALQREQTSFAAAETRSRAALEIATNSRHPPLARMHLEMASEAKTARARRRISRLENDIRVNMEFWRWQPRHIGADRIDVNIPAFTLALVRDGVVVHRARVIVGKPKTPTPVFSSAVKYIEINPYWNVPQSILHKEILPHLARDPDYFQRMGFEARMWHGRLFVRQRPGARNALGRIKFVFPNHYAVYLHDTPQKSLFRARRRAFSHGCVRVDQPLALAELVLGKNSGWTLARLEKLIGGPNRAIRLRKALPIDIDYFTAWVDENGKLRLRNDIYGYSHKLEHALGLKS